MEQSFFLGLIENIALLLVFSLLYESRWIDNIHSKKLMPKIFAGIAVGAIGVLLISIPWTYQIGYTLDFRSVLLSIAGLYLGIIPTLIAILITGSYRIFLGGEILFLGIFLIVSSGLIGVGWRYFLQKKGAKNTTRSLYVFGLLVHLFMVMGLLLLPKEQLLLVVKAIALPIIIIYPMTTVLLGWLLNKQLENWQNRKAKERFNESELRFAKMMLDINVLFINLDLNSNFVFCNKYFLSATGYKEEEVIGKNSIDIFIPVDEKERVKERLSRLFQNDVDLNRFESRVLTKDKKELYVSWHSSLIIDSEGNIKGIASLGENITEKQVIFDNLKEAKEKAEESNRLKSVFLQNISHEIRTPMNSIIGFISLLKESPVDEETRDEFYEIIDLSGKRLIATVNDLIDISQIETQQIKVKKSDVSISVILANQLNLATPLAAKKNIKVTCTSKYLSAQTVLNTDRNLLDSIFINLIANAIKFTKSGTIEIGSRDEHADIVFFIKDTGIGIPKNRIDAIYDRFVQANSGLNRSHEGSGLGLSIAKAYAQLLGGDLWVESEEGIGSTFFFNIPNNVVRLTKHETSKTEDTEENIQQNVKILIAEDDELSYLFLKRLLEDKGVEILYANNGADAVEMVRDTEISLVLMDIKMPKMSGKEAIQQIRTFNRNIPIIAQTAFAMPTDRNKFIELGCNDYISKPIERDKLIRLLRKYLNSPNEETGSQRD